MTQSSHEFRTVMRGYEPSEVDRTLAQLQNRAEELRVLSESQRKSVEEATAQNKRLRDEVDAAVKQAQLDRLRVQELEAELEKESQPSAAAVTERAAKILRLAEDEASELRAQAKADGESVMADADEYAAQVRQTAETEAAEITNKAEAAGAATVEAASRKADELLDQANREATTRREEAEAIFERQRARAASAAAEFEKTLATRRDKAASEFAHQMDAYEQALSATEQRRMAIQAEADRLLAEAKEEAEGLKRAAREEAAQRVDDARLAAERVRKESERELMAATARREAVTAQLTNVRQMLAALGAGPLLDALGEDDEAPAAITESVDFEADAEDVETDEADDPAVDTDEAEDTEATEVDPVEEEADEVENAQ